jgi:hypothetical protein
MMSLGARNGCSHCFGCCGYPAHMFILQVLLGTGIGGFFLFWGGVDH